MTIERLRVELWFWFHLALLLGSWAAPFLVSWPYLIGIYAIVLLQFAVLGRCVVNRLHELHDDQSNHTFYADILERLGFQPDRAKVRSFVRSWIYLVLLCVGLLWQEVLGHAPLLI